MNLLYKYFSNQRLSFFDNQLVRFTQPSAFNDPFEFMPYEPFIPEIADERLNGVIELNPESSLCGNEKRDEDRYLNIKIDFAVELQTFMIGTYDNLGVFCLSEEWDNILMWSHYADNHNGFVVGFDITHPFFKDNEFGLDPITYSKFRPHSLVSDNYIQNLVYTKSEVWGYEKEWRICKTKDKASNLIDDNIYLYQIPVEAIACVYLGMRMTNGDRNNIIEKILSWRITPALYQIYMNTREYKINAKRVTVLLQ